MKQRVEPRITDQEAAAIILAKPDQYGPLMLEWSKNILKGLDTEVGGKSDSVESAG